MATSTNTERILITAAEAAALLSMGKSTFWREVAKGNLPDPVKIGSLTRWRVTDLQQFVLNLRIDTDSAKGIGPGDSKKAGAA